MSGIVRSHGQGGSIARYIAMLYPSAIFDSS